MNKSYFNIKLLSIIQRETSLENREINQIIRKVFKEIKSYEDLYKQKKGKKLKLSHHILTTVQIPFDLKPETCSINISVYNNKIQSLGFN